MYLFDLLKKHNIKLSSKQSKYLLNLLSSSGNDYNQSYERAEILGDSMLNFFTIKFIYKEFPDATEGKISKIKSMVVSSFSFAFFLGKLLFDMPYISSKNETNAGDMFEVIFGYIYSQFENSDCLLELENIYRGILAENIDYILNSEECLDYKSCLQSLTQRYFKLLPQYVKIDSDQMFIIRCKLNTINVLGYGQSIKKAEQNAAKKVLMLLNVDINENFVGI